MEDETKKLGIFAIGVIVLSMIVLLGIMVLTRIDYSTRSTTSANVASITLGNVLTSAAVGSSGTYPFLQTATACVNSSNDQIKFNTSYYTVNEGGSSGGTIYLLNVSSGQPVNGTYWQGSSINCTITYKANSDISTAASTFATGLTTFAIFVGLIILAYIGKIIINMFRKGL